MQETHRPQFNTRGCQVHCVLEKDPVLYTHLDHQARFDRQRRSIPSALLFAIFTLQVHKLTHLVPALFDNDLLCIYLLYSFVNATLQAVM